MHMRQARIGGGQEVEEEQQQQLEEEELEGCLLFVITNAETRNSKLRRCHGKQLDNNATRTRTRPRGLGRHADRGAGERERHARGRSVGHCVWSIIKLKAKKK